MAQITDRKSAAGSCCEQQKPEKIRSSCFLGCFGGGNNKRSLEKGETVGMKKTRSSVWFSWSKLKKRSFPRKTVPLDHGGCADDKVHSRKGSIFHMKSGKKLHKDQPNQMKYDNVQEIVLENSESKNHIDSLKKPMFKKGLCGINMCTSQKCSINGNLTSPEDKFEVSRGRVAQLSHSVSMPPPGRKKTVSNIISSGGDSGVNIKEKTSQSKTDARRFDQFAGIAMIIGTLTLIVMVFCGKIFAILCTCAWFYFYPVLVVVVRGKNEPKVGQEISPKPGDEIDFNSPEYKKKVVLEGFLKRNHQIQL